MRAEILLVGNEGFRLRTGGRTLFIDAFWGGFPSGGMTRAFRAADVSEADLILITHGHWDHFSTREVADVASRTNARVIAPAPVIELLGKCLPSAQLLGLEPPQATGSALAHTAAVECASLKITAYRTSHGKAHNSYLVEAPDFRWFHDGDNEDTARLPVEALGELDALFLCPWQGSGWVEFVEQLSPGRWLLMHLSDEEVQAHARGAFLPELCERVPIPDRIVALAPGEALKFP